MTRVLAAVDRSAAATPVISTAAALAHLLGAEVDAVHVREAPRSELAVPAAGVQIRVLEGSVIDALLAAANAPDVAVVVMGARGTPAGRQPAGRTAIELAQALGKPLVLVPPSCHCPVQVRRVLAAVDSATARQSGLLQTVEGLVGVAPEMTVLHVRDDTSIPAFEDQPHHARQAWERAFRRRTGARHGKVPLRLRTGSAADLIIATAHESEADMIALAWGQNLLPGRSVVVQAVLERSTIPVLLVPSEAPGPG
jgi:nucleotide-binding universal stress UspA family protein